MIIITTTVEKFEKGVTVLKSHGGIVDKMSENHGLLSFGYAFCQISGKYHIEAENVTVTVIDKPFFLADEQIMRYMTTVLN